MMYRDALPHSACHKERFLLIFSVPHAVLDDKMATAAIHVVLMWKPDAQSFYLLSACSLKSATQPPPRAVGAENS